MYSQQELERHRERFTEILDYYRENIKPQIENPETRDCGIREMGNIVAAFNLDALNANIIRSYHNGANLLAESEVLFKKMRGSESISVDDCLRFEAYLAQVTLAMKSGNKY